MPIRFCMLLAAGLSVACSSAESASTAVRYNEEVKKREKARKPREDRASVPFQNYFTAAQHVDVKLSGEEVETSALNTMQARPSFCHVGAGGDVYLGSLQSPYVDVWSTRDNAVRRFATDEESAREKPAALFWHAGENALYVLSRGRKGVLKYDPSGRLLDYLPINAGQDGSSLHVMQDGRLLIGGPRWEDTAHIKLLALHDARGRLEQSFFAMDSSAVRNSVQLSPSVMIAPVGEQQFLAAEPYSYRISLLNLRGERIRTLGEPHQEYRGPPPLHGPIPPFEQIGIWRRSWNPLVFLHRAGDYVFAAFQVHLPRRSAYRIEVYDLEGRRVQTGLVHDSRPICGDGEGLILASAGDPNAVRLTRYVFRGERPTAPDAT